ncbi:hypothetical protein NOGI109294_19880 [Nocardiopsis gilva]|uniref:hypothetical protein n=1 Tax=Nocardiopsis gilva TaxID=280236 RepID=UPI00034A88F8|nr:hypothetical protein [Nocardiopsis gilva]
MAAAVVVVPAIAVTAGLWWGEDGPAFGAGPDDAFSTAPECAVVAAETVEGVVPSGRLETNEHGPLSDADGAMCAWTSVGADGAAPRFLRVDFEARFTDKAGDVTGASAAAREMERSTTISDVEGAAPLPSLGEDALVWPGADEGTAELVFRRDNLVVRVSYGGAADTGGKPLSFGAARDGAVDVAEQVADSL